MRFKLKKRLCHRRFVDAVKCALVLTLLSTGMADAATINVNTSVGFDKDNYSNAANIDNNWSNRQFISIKDLNDAASAKVAYVQFNVAQYSPTGVTKVELVLSARQVAGDTTVELRQASNTTWDETQVNSSTAPSVSYGATVLKSFDVTQLDKVLDTAQGELYTIDITDLITSAGDYSFALTISANANSVDFFSSAAQEGFNQPQVNFSGTKGFSVSPSYFIVKGGGNVTNRKQIITITNEGSYDFTFKGNDTAPNGILYEEYNKTNSTCNSNTVLATGQSCEFTLIQLKTATTVPNHDIFRIKYLYADLDNTTRRFPLFIKDISAEATAEQAKRRIAPLLKNFRVTDLGTDTPIAALPIAGTAYDAKFNIDGYHDSYRTIIALFDCADTTAESCAAGFGSNIGWVEATAGYATTGATTYNSYASSVTEFTGTITMPAYSNNLVARVYYRADVDEAMKHHFISVIAAGGQGMSLADGLGRKIIIEAAQ
ncbi:hypothetical protein RI844_05690 [Thalassotalea fonticola]|uniref:Carbohydrate-binding module family 96 domain-containing protein n=1 Tax=Thalassotalea fonticola TaxID=3065649 RepID=A0ABZ0GTK5_9GAMM|nr:hypothetical protein RI844_05690 [Colwelliaceae bacterium S1-1]